MKFAEIRKQPPPPPPPSLGIGPAPAAIEEVIPRTAVDIDDCWFPWATDFALFSDTHVHGVAPCVPTGNWRQTYPQAPRPGGEVTAIISI